MATRSDSGQSARFGRILKTLFGSTRRHWRGLIALALLLHFLVWKLRTEFAVSFPQYCHDMFGWTLATGSEVKLFDLAVTNLSIAVVIAHVLLRCSLALPITIVEGLSARMSMKRSRQLTSLRRSKATIWLCLLAYSPMVALLFIGSLVDITANVGGVAMWFILTAAVLFTSLMATGCYLFIRPGQLKV